MSNTKVTQIDDNDASVTKTGNWVLGGSPHEYQGTVTYSLTNGATLSVPFTGTQIGVYGTYDSSSNGVVTSYQVDNQKAVTVNHKASSGNDVYKSPFWVSDTLPAGDHKLTVTLVKANPQPDNEGTVWFDYFQVTNDLTAQVSASNNTGAAVPPTNSGKSTTPSQTSKKPSTSPTTSAAPAPAKANNTGGIIAGVVVGLLLLLAVTGLFLFYRNRKKRKADLEDIIQEKPGFDYMPPAPVPYNTAPQTPSSGYPFLSNNAVSSGSSMPLLPPQNFSSLPPGAAPPNPQSRPSFSSAAGLSSIGAMATLSYDDPEPSEYAQPSRAGGSSSGPSVGPSSTAGTSLAGGRALTVANDSSHGDSVAELKQRAKEAMIAEQNLLKEQYPIHNPVQHVDSGIRTYHIDPTQQMELPPVYSAS